MCLPGMTMAVGTGIMHLIGGATAATANQLTFSGVGGTAAVGDGDMMWLGIAATRSTLCQAQVRLASSLGGCSIGSMPLAGMRIGP